jgi:hypothetical protein
LGSIQTFSGGIFFREGVGGYVGGSFHGEIFHGALEFPALFKKQSEVKYKNKFFQLKVRSNIKT